MLITDFQFDYVSYELRPSDIETVYWIACHQVMMASAAELNAGKPEGNQRTLHDKIRSIA